MRRTTSLLLVGLVLSLSATAQTEKTGRPALPSNIAAVAAQDSFELLKNPAIKARMKRLLGDKYESFMESFETVNPITRSDNLLFSSGCLIHACTHLESAIAIDLKNKTIHTAIFRQDEKTRFFNEDRTATPKVIRDWANNLRQINRATNSSGYEHSFVASNVAAAKVEPSAIRRLRSSTTVRGFIGGESHDSYVVRARRGTVLTILLSWQREGDNSASLSVSESPDFYSGEPVRFGAEYDSGQRWTGKIPKSGDYYISVVAHPSARYTLKVSNR